MDNNRRSVDPGLFMRFNKRVETARLFFCNNLLRCAG